MPPTLEESLRGFKDSKFAEEFLGKDVRDHIHTCLYSEVVEYNKAVTDFELKRYFDQV